MSVIDEKILSLLRCPNSGETLKIADADLIAALNQSILDGNVSNASGEAVSEVIDGGLINQSGTWMAPLYGRIIDLNPTDTIDIRELTLSEQEATEFNHE